MARARKVEIWIHFPQGNVEKRYMETCNTREHAETVIGLMERKFPENSYSIETCGTVKKLGQIVYR